ncbi:hypothetical protein ACA616_17480, partial [Lactiplantibacillus pentosus]
DFFLIAVVLGRVGIRSRKIQFWHSALKRGVVVRSQKSLPAPPLSAKNLFTTQTKKDGSAKIAETSFLNPWALSPQSQTKLSQLDRYRSPPLGSGKQGLVFQGVRLLVLSSLSTP